MTQQKESIKEIIASSKKQFLEDLDTVLSIPSVKGPKAAGAPFGKENKKVLEQVMALAESYGFKTEIVNDAVGYAQFGEGEDYIGVVGHLDVVAAGTGWDYPPYQLTQVEETLYGRGVLDNKGPIMSCLFGLKLLKDLEIPLKKPIRIVFGTDEESGSSDLPLYLAEEKPPIFGFTPDCKYPVVYGERGIVNVAITTEISADVLTSISAIVGEQGKAFVPDDLSCTVKDKAIHVEGKRSPSNAPALGKNAITLLAKALIEEDELPEELKAYFSWIYTSFHEKHDGAGLNLALVDEDSGKLMVTPYELTKTEIGFTLSIAIRYPVRYTETDVITRLQNALPNGGRLDITRSIPSTIYPKDDPNVLKLAKVYEEVTGMDGTPVTTTGATYARYMPNIVAFGPSFPGQKGIAHNANEYMDVTDLLTNMEIYMTAMISLAND